MEDGTLEWLLDADPAIRWQVMRDLTDEAGEVIANERARVATEGWGARLLDLQGEDGNWGGGAYSSKWISTTYTLLVLRHLGIDVEHSLSPQLRSAVSSSACCLSWWPAESDRLIGAHRTPPSP